MTLTASRRNLRNVAGFVFALALSVVVAPAAQNGPPGYINDNSDWWSHTRTVSPDKAVVKDREPDSSNFEILGLKLDSDLFSKAATKLGKAQITERGDAATGRSQVCYRSSNDSERVYLIFESGEVTESFYLFAGGPAWKGSDLCVKSRFVTTAISAASGLRLGQTRDEVKAILGEPSTVAKNRLIYSYSVQKKSLAADFDYLRQQHPELSEEDLHRNYEFYSLGVYIEARFSSDKLNYLVVSKAEAY